MSRSIAFRQAGRLLAASIGPGTCISAAYILRPSTVRLDAVNSAPIVSRRQAPSAGISTKAAQQMSTGSLTGFASGLLVALFSRTLVFLGGFLALSGYVASRYGFDLPKYLGVKKLLNQSALWRKFGGSPWFSVSFALTFTLAAFARL